jgi:hypothetical protein
MEWHFGVFTGGYVPFDEYQNNGIRNSRRGFPSGKYKSKYMVAGQAEYR